MNISYFLTRPESENETGIYARICYAGIKFKYYVPEKIAPKFWNIETRKARQTAKFTEHAEFNARLDNWVSSMKNIYRKYANDNSGTIPSPETLRPLFDLEIKKIEPKKNVVKTFTVFFKDIIDQTEKGLRINHATGKSISKNTLKSYTTTHNHLLEYQKTLKRDIQFKDIDLDFYNDYSEYLKGTKLSGNTIGKDIKIIKMVMHDATERGINDNLAFKSKRFTVIKEDSESIYLTMPELNEMEALDLSNDKPHERVRDLFLIGCMTGLRYSDFSTLKPENIKNGFIEITQIKTGQKISIPVHNTVKKIIAKYKGLLPESISNQKTNEYLKTICQKIPSLKVITNIKSKKENNGVAPLAPKWELVTTHTARRSFATNQYKAGVPAITIMAITGHTTEKSFLKYIKLASNEHAKILQGHWDKQNTLSIAK